MSLDYFIPAPTEETNEANFLDTGSGSLYREYDEVNN